MSITTTICAHNAEKTIGRAIASALSAGDNPILLVDDFSTDKTVAVARQLAGTRIQVVRPKEKRGIGNARQTALDHLETPFALWLDADDELLPGRPSRLLDLLEKHTADLVYDAGVLVAASGQETPLWMPDFLRARDGHLRLLERNWLPGLWGGFRTDFAKKIGYDPAFLNSEDYDFLLRSLFAGARIQLETKSGYRYHHTDTSLSRDLVQAVNFTGIASDKHKLERYQDLLTHSALSKSEQRYTLAANQMVRGNYETVVQLSSEKTGNYQKIRPYGQTADQLFRFLRATALLKLEEPQPALALLQSYPAQTPEAFNNLGAALKLTGHVEEAAASFETALSKKPGYVDALRNLDALNSESFPAITLLPIRPVTSRSDYKI